MKWEKFTIHTKAEATDLISAMLSDIGIEGIEIVDKKPLSEADTKGMFIDILPDLGTDDGNADISFYLEPDSNIEEILNRVREGLDELEAFTELGDKTITKSETEDKDWINNWKQFFKPFTVEDILIKPTWEDVPINEKDKLLIEIDPGTAFGTGSHETTQLCIKALNKYIKKMKAEGKDINVLDVGTGSGILGIAALKLGAKAVFATDLDECAIDAVYENLATNHISKDDFKVCCGNIIDDENIQNNAGYECYDIAVANILAPIIIMLQNEVYKHIKHGGLFISSGIIDMKEKDVVAAIKANSEFEILEINHQGEWVSVVARRV